MPIFSFDAPRSKGHARVTAARPDVSRVISIVLALSTAAVMLLSAANAAGAQAQGVAHLAGGVSADERTMIAAREGEYNVKLVFTLVEGNYLADVGVAIKDASGRVVLDTRAPGPILLARLPKGEYTVDATHDGKTQTRKLVAGERLRTVYLRWPSDPHKDFPGPKSSRP